MITLKRFLIICIIILILFLVAYNLYYYTDFGVYLPAQEIATFTHTDEDSIYILIDGQYEKFEIRGVNMGSGIPGHFSTDYAITKEQYLRWFDYIKQMGANTIRVYTILGTSFYDAVYEYNMDNPNPLYILHGVSVNDYMQFSRRDAYDEELFNQLQKDSRKVVDVIWGKRNVSLGKAAGTGFYRHNISPWVIGYIIGAEWEDLTVVYTDNKYVGKKDSYIGNYMYTTDDASPFEAMLACVGDGIIEYESKRYDAQRMVAFSNWPNTDPFEYDEEIAEFFKKIAKIDVENIKTTNRYISGTFASYHVYPYYPDFLGLEGELTNRINFEGDDNSYYAYLKMLNDHHTMPVIISEYGAPSSRATTHKDDIGAGIQVGGMSEEEQAKLIVECYEDIEKAGCAGSIVFEWHDEWFRRTWSTMHAVDFLNTAYWSDYQTDEQSFGLLTFDPGAEKSICYVDGDITEWIDVMPLIQNDALSLSMQYDEKFVYFKIEYSGLSKEDTVYIPIDSTPKTGASYCENYGLTFDRDIDFIISINGLDNSRVLVQERYEVLRAIYAQTVYDIDAYIIPPEKDTTKFVPINMIMSTTLQSDDETNNEQSVVSNQAYHAEVYETGRLMEGNANPYMDDFNSLADFCYGKDCVEIRIPWQLLNFSSPNEMKIHDDYYVHYGIQPISIDQLNVGVTVNPNSDDVIKSSFFELNQWNQQATYHERLKAAYYALQQVWTGKDEIYDD